MGENRDLLITLVLTLGLVEYLHVSDQLLPTGTPPLVNDLLWKEYGGSLLD